MRFTLTCHRSGGFWWTRGHFRHAEDVRPLEVDFTAVIMQPSEYLRRATERRKSDGESLVGFVITVCG